MLKKKFKKSLVKVWKYKKCVYICISKLSNQLKNKPMKTQLTIKDLKQAITNQDELNIIAKEIWFMNFIRLIKLKFSVDFATKKATEISERQISLLIN